MRHLACFRAVAQTGSVTRAAEALGTVQPSVSRSLRQLEEELGTALFERTASGLVLNEAGRTLLAYVATGMGQIDRGIDAIRGGMEGDRITAYVLPNVVRTIMPGAVRRFKSFYPEIDIVLLGVTGKGLQEYTMRSDVDFIFGRLLAVEQMEGLSFEHLFSEPLVFVARADHPLAGRAGLTVADLDAFPIILPTSGTIIRSEVDRFLHGQGFSRFTNLIETVNFEFARTYIAQTDAICCQPRGAMRRELREGQSAILDFATDALNGAVGITIPATRPPSAPAQFLIQMIREEVGDQGLS